MAAILDAMAPYVTKLIADMATEEVAILLGVSGEIEKLKDNMEIEHQTASLPMLRGGASLNRSCSDG